MLREGKRPAGPGGPGKTPGRLLGVQSREVICSDSERTGAAGVEAGDQSEGSCGPQGETTGVPFPALDWSRETATASGPRVQGLERPVRMHRLSGLERALSLSSRTL